MAEEIIYGHFNSRRHAGGYRSNSLNNIFGPLRESCIPAQNQKVCNHEHGELILTSVCYFITNWSDFKKLPSERVLRHILEHLTRSQV